MSGVSGDKRVVIPLIVIAIAAICLPVVRMKSALEKRGRVQHASIAERTQPAKRPAVIKSMAHVIMPERDPFWHDSLDNLGPGGSGNPGGVYGLNTEFGGPDPGAFPAPPAGWLEGLTSDLPALKTGGGATPAGKSAPESGPQLTLTTILRGAEPLAILRDRDGTAHIVGPGDRVGRDVAVVSITDESVTLRFKGRDIVLRLGER